MGNTHVQMSNKPQLPSAQPTSCVAPESSGKNPCYSLVSAPLMAIGRMELVREYIQATLVKKMPSGPIKRAKKSKKLNPKWRSEVKGDLCAPTSPTNQTTLWPADQWDPSVQGHLSSLCWRRPAAPLISDYASFPQFCYFHLCIELPKRETRV